MNGVGVESFRVSVMRKMCADEQPLPLCLSWGSHGLATHKFVLHENDSGDVIVSAASRGHVTCLVGW